MQCVTSLLFLRFEGLGWSASRIDPPLLPSLRVTTLDEVLPRAGVHQDVRRALFVRRQVPRPPKRVHFGASRTTVTPVLLGTAALSAAVCAGTPVKMSTWSPWTRRPRSSTTKQPSLVAPPGPPRTPSSS